MMGRFRQRETNVGQAEPRGFDGSELRLGDIMRGERATLGKSLLDVQRELKIRATYISAIENSDPEAFETPGFIAGYVRSYARYLDLDPDWAYRAFCAESDLEAAHGMPRPAAPRGSETETARPDRDPLAEPSLGYAPPRGGILTRIEPGAIGSLVVLLGLIGAIGYGGYAVLNEVQRVRIVPVEQTPEIVAEIDPLNAARGSRSDAEPGGAEAPTIDAFARIYRPEALDLPVLVSRDGPISALDPRRGGALAPTRDAAGSAGRRSVSDAPGSLVGLDAADIAELLPSGARSTPAVPDPAVQVVAAAPPQVVIIAVRPSWVRVRSAEGTTIYERIMQEGDRFVLPPSEAPATLRTGESGAIFFAVDGQAYGPAGPAGQVTGNLALDAKRLAASYDRADLDAESALARVVAELQPAPPDMPARASRDEAPARASRDEMPGRASRDEMPGRASRDEMPGRASRDEAD